MARVLCISMVLGLAAAQDQERCEIGRCEESEEVGLLQFGPVPPPKDCLTIKDMDKTMETFMHAVTNIGQHVDDCAKAKATATASLDAAYAYNVKNVTVLFKPTLTEAPNVYRPTQAGALSYFVGACVCPGVEKPVFPAPKGCGMKQGYYEPDNGFAFGPDFTQWSKVSFGGVKKGGNPKTKTNFWYNVGGRFCQAPQAQGPICFTDQKGEDTCVDKTFSFVPNPDKKGALRALIVVHDSSLQM